MIRTKIRKINPQKSNKMIYAVAAGLVVILIAFFMSIFFTGGGTGKKNQTLQKNLAYLKSTEGLVEIKTIEAENRAVIIFNSDSKNARNFEKIAHFAAIRLSYKLPDCQVQLAKNKETNIVYSVQIKKGKVVSEGPIQSRTDRP